MKAWKHFLLGAASIFDFGGALRTKEREALLDELRPDPRSDWELLCQDGQNIQQDFARAWVKVKAKAKRT